MPPHFFYVGWDINYEMTKVGISKRPTKRQADHAGNSANPLQFEVWKFAKLESFENAKKLEALVCSELRKQGLLVEGKRELFKCSFSTPWQLARHFAIHHSIDCIFDVPASISEMNRDFIGIPECIREVLPSAEVSAFNRGFKTALETLSFLKGVPLSADTLQAAAFERLTNDADPVECLLNCLASQFSGSMKDHEMLKRARREIEKWNQETFFRWQELDED
jgi:hypothetical protein